LFARLSFLIFKAFRIAVVQGTTVITNYYNDQLKCDIEREERVAQGNITRQQADREDKEWQEVRLSSRHSTPENRNESTRLLTVAEI
jgi:hypothetical protein